MTGEGSASAEITPHPARIAIRATFSHRGRRETRADVHPRQGGPHSKALAQPLHRRHICERDTKIAETKSLRKLHGGYADRLRYSSRGGRNPHHAAALSRRPLERA